MFLLISVVMLMLAIALPMVSYYRGDRTARRFKNVLAVNVTAFFGVLLLATIGLFTNTAFAAATTAESLASANGMAFLSAALSTGLGSIGAGLAVGSAASAALGALSENEGIMGKALVFVGLAEGISIFGFVISFLILNNVVK